MRQDACILTSAKPLDPDVVAMTRRMYGHQSLSQRGNLPGPKKLTSWAGKAESCMPPTRTPWQMTRVPPHLWALEACTRVITLQECFKGLRLGPQRTLLWSSRRPRIQAPQLRCGRSCRAAQRPQGSLDNPAVSIWGCKKRTFPC